MQAENQVTKHHGYGLVLWKIFVCEEQIKRLISLRIQFPNCALYLKMGDIQSHEYNKYEIEKRKDTNRYM